MSRFKRFLPLLVALVILLLGGFAYIAISHFGIEALISTIGLFGVASVIFAESGLLIGFFLPGDSLLFTAGFLVQQNLLHISIHILALILFCAAAAGDSTGYAFGRRLGPRLFTRKNSLLFKVENVRRAQEFYEKYGAKTIVIARFVPVVRTFAPIVAGIGKMPYKTFVTYNIIGAFLWATGLTYLGFFAGSFITMTGVNIEYVILGIIFLSVLPPAIHVLKDSGNRRALRRSIDKTIRDFKKK